MNDIEDLIKQKNTNTEKFKLLDNNAIFEFLGVKTKKEYHKKYNEVRFKYKKPFTKRELYYLYRKNNIQNDFLESCLIKSPSRSQHGVIVISVIMGPHKFSCSHNCSYCPTYPEYAKSYIPEEPTVQRDERNNFKGDLQLKERVFALMDNGHQVDKLEVIVLGGTFSNYPPNYAEEFINELYFGANTVFDNQSDLRKKLSLKEERFLNENSNCKIIGLTLETRPDYISFYELRRFRNYGCTRIQLGVQSTDDEVLKKNNRECYNNDTINAIQLCLDNCFKIDIHIMPDLPYSTFESDHKTMFTILNDHRFYAGQYKIYPTMVTENTEIKKWYNEGTYKPMYESQEGIEKLIQLCIFLNKISKEIKELIV